MGSLTYEGRTVEFEDRLLTHLQIVIVNRFRRGEAFLLSWIDAVEVGSGRSSVWLTPSTPVHFHFTASRVPQIDRAWIASLDAAAASATGLVVADEEGRPVRVGAGAAATRSRPAAPLVPTRQPVAARSEYTVAGLRR